MAEEIYQIAEQIVQLHQKAIYPSCIKVILKHIGKCGRMKIVIQEKILKGKEN